MLGRTGKPGPFTVTPMQPREGILTPLPCSPRSGIKLYSKSELHYITICKIPPGNHEASPHLAQILGDSPGLERGQVLALRSGAKGETPGIRTTSCVMWWGVLYPGQLAWGPRAPAAPSEPCTTAVTSRARARAPAERWLVAPSSPRPGDWPWQSAHVVPSS